MNWAWSRKTPNATMAMGMGRTRSAAQGLMFEGKTWNKSTPFKTNNLRDNPVTRPCTATPAEEPREHEAHWALQMVDNNKWRLITENFRNPGDRIHRIQNLANENETLIGRLTKRSFVERLRGRCFRAPHKRSFCAPYEALF